MAAEIERWREVPYDDLVRHVGEALHVNVQDKEGKVWIRETQLFWDDRKRRNIRVMVDVWDPGRRVSRSTAIDDFLRAPNGSFVGE